MENSLITLDTESQRQYALMQTPMEQKMFVLMRSPKAVNSSETDFIMLIGELYAYSKQQITPAEQVGEARMLQAEVQKYFSFISFDELREALNEGIRATGDDAMFGLNIKEMNKAIQRYMIAVQPKRKAVLQRLSQPQAEPTEEQKEKILMDALGVLKQKVAGGESLIENTAAFGVYKWLKRTKKINGSMFPPDAVEAIKTQAEGYIRQKAAAKQQKVSRESRTEGKQIIMNLENGLLENDIDAIGAKLALEYLIKQGKI